jgi:hypothetical protein
MGSCRVSCDPGVSWQSHSLLQAVMGMIACRLAAGGAVRKAAREHVQPDSIVRSAACSELTSTRPSTTAPDVAVMVLVAFISDDRKNRDLTQACKTPRCPDRLNAERDGSHRQGKVSFDHRGIRMAGQKQQHNCFVAWKPNATLPGMQRRATFAHA